MAVDECTETTKLLRLRASAEGDPGVVSRLLSHFQILNIIPHRIVAEFATTGLVHVQIDVSGLSESRLSLIAAKMSQCAPPYSTRSGIGCREGTRRERHRK
jgi:hypothetical protein